MNLNSRINGLVKLGKFLAQFSKAFSANEELEVLNNKFREAMEASMIQAKIQNGWFTIDHIYLSLSAWGNMLTEEKVNEWVSNYKFNEGSKRSVGIIMAGNIPLVGFHDLVAVILSGNRALVKLSSEDKVLIPKLLEVLVEIDAAFNDYFKLILRLENPDAVIATGSNNSARYFEHYFGKYPHIIRKNRTSISVIDGTETEEELCGLAEDIMLYFGLGCRNVSKVYIPMEYDLDHIFKALFPYREYGNHNKFANNYDYNKAIYLLNSEPLLENGFMLLREAKELNSPVGVLLYERYENMDNIKTLTEERKEELQCVVSKNNIFSNTVPFGQAQRPELWDYADGVDTLAFLSQL